MLDKLDNLVWTKNKFDWSLCGADEKGKEFHILIIDEFETYNILWQLRKDGKDLNLYDQSKEMLEFVWRILK